MEFRPLEGFRKLDYEVWDHFAWPSVPLLSALGSAEARHPGNSIRFRVRQSKERTGPHRHADAEMAPVPLNIIVEQFCPIIFGHIPSYLG